jgi:formylglycine-generating enzyme required for sulfatase activity
MLSSPFGGDSLTSKGLYTFVAGPDDSGSYNAIAVVSDGELTDTVILHVVVSNVNRPPTVTLLEPIDSAQNFPKTTVFRWRVADPDGDVLTSTVRIGISSAQLINVQQSRDTTGTFASILQAGQEYFWQIVVSDGITEVTSITKRFSVLPNAPNIPTILSINAQSSSTIKIVWNTVTGASFGYKLFRSETNAGAYAKIAETQDTFFTDAGLNAQTDYYYRISASNPGGESGQSVVASTKTYPAPPGAPLGFLAEPKSTKRILLTWRSTNLADAYKLYRAESQPSNYSAIGPTAIIDTFYNDTVGLTANTIYYYKLTSTNLGGESQQPAFSNAKTYPNIPDPPVITVAGGSKSVIVTWDGVLYATTYNLYYAQGDTVNKSKKQVLGATSPDTITGLWDGHNYSFAVSSVNISGESALSGSKTIVTIPAAPFIAATPGNDTVTVNWGEVPGAASYTLYFCVGDSIDTTTFRYTNVKPPVVLNSYPIRNGTKYSFAAIAINASGKSELSNVVSCMPVLPRRMVWIPGGSFTMGTNSNSNENPAHTVMVHTFLMDSTEVTLQDYESIMGPSNSYFSGAQIPVNNRTWYDAALYCNQISKKGGLDTVYRYSSATIGYLGFCTGLASLAIDYAKNGYRLPTEAEWEYACRAGSTTTYYWGDTMNGDYCWYNGNSDDKVHAVAQKKPNAFGLYDMSGNAWEYCNDYLAPYDTTVKVDPTGPATGTSRTRRGGSYAGNTELRSASRDASNKFPDSGFRCVRR